MCRVLAWKGQRHAGILLCVQVFTAICSTHQDMAQPVETLNHGITPPAAPRQDGYTLSASKTSEAAKFALERCGRMLLRGHSRPPECFTVTEQPDGGMSLLVAPGGCLELSTEAFDHWYGGPPMACARWPSSLGRIVTQPWRSNDMLGDRSRIGSLLEGIWLTSRGVSIRLLPHGAPLDFSFNDHTETNDHLEQLDASASQGGGVLRLRATGSTGFEVQLRVWKDAREAHEQTARSLPHPSSPQSPSLEVMRAPVWSTWARYKMGVDQANVAAYAEEIASLGFPRSQLEIDDKWCAGYGDFAFDLAKFPHPPAMVARLHAMGFAVTLWVTPFAELSSLAFAEGAALGHWVTKGDGSGEPAVVRWWQGDGVLLNVSDSKALDWMEGRMRGLMAATGIDGFKFDAGESEFVPPNADANAYATAWVAFAARFGGRGEVRCTSGSQGEGVWTREFDKDSSWGADNGLRALVVTALQHGVVGYPFVLPDMVGGNAYSEELLVSGHSGGAGAGAGGKEGGNGAVASSMFFGGLPDRELYVRWCYATALLPAIQFSIAPWQYDETTTTACKKALHLRERYLPVLEALAAHAVATGEPIVRPVWWRDPTDAVCLTVDDAFLLGPSTLVAPVLEPGARSRRVYLPRGRWAAVGPEPRREYVGPRWIEEYRVELDELAVFELIEEEGAGREGEGERREGEGHKGGREDEIA